MKSVLNDILAWLRDPDDNPSDVSLQEKLKVLCYVLILDFLFGFVFLCLIYLIDLYVLRLNEDLFAIDPIILLLSAVVLMPVLEEIVFRLPLKYERNYLIRGLDSLFGGSLKQKWPKYYKYFVYGMAIAFGLVHLTNYSNKEFLFYCLGPIIVGSQLVGGLMLSYVRVKLGFLWSVLHHGLFNLIGVMLMLLFCHNSIIIDKSNDDYVLKISELMYVHPKKSSYEVKHEDGLIYSISGKQINLQRVVNSLNNEDVKLYHDTWVDINFESDNGVTASELLSALQSEIRFE